MPVKIHLTFPSKFAGPLIGKQASNLAHIKKFSGASKIHVFPKDREAPERYIEIIGTPLQQYFVSLLLFTLYCISLFNSKNRRQKYFSDDSWLTWKKSVVPWTAQTNLKSGRAKKSGSDKEELGTTVPRFVMRLHAIMFILGP